MQEKGQKKGAATLFSVSLFHDSRPDLYGLLLIANGTTPMR